MARAVDAAREAFDRGPWPKHVARRAGRVPAGDRRGAARQGGRGRPDLAARVRRPLRHRPVHGARHGRRLRLLRRPRRRRIPSRSGQADHGRRVRPARPRAGRRRRGDHPVERAHQPHLLQDRPRAPRRVHRRPQVLARGARRRLPLRRDRRGHRAAARRPQRRHRRPRGLRAPGAQPRRRQDHLHRLDRRRAAHRLALRRADRPLHARARRQVRRGDPRRHGPRRPRPAPSRAPSASSAGRCARR